MVFRLSEQELDDILKKGHTKISEGYLEAIEKKKKPRVNSNKIEIDGHLFDSKSEGKIYVEFKLDPSVTILELQPEFILVPEFELRGKKYQSIKFTPDFRILQDGIEFIVEVKSKGTMLANSKSYSMRRKMFLKNNPELRYREIIFNRDKRTEKIY